MKKMKLKMGKKVKSNAKYLVKAKKMKKKKMIESFEKVKTLEMENDRKEQVIRKMPWSFWNNKKSVSLPPSTCVSTFSGQALF